MPSTVLKPAVTVESIEAASTQIYDLVQHTPLEYSDRLSKRYSAKVYLKREDQQVVRSYKLRGAYNLMKGLTAAERAKGAVTASAGDHAQEAALSYTETTGAVFVHPFNDPRVMAGQGTVGQEIYKELGAKLDVVV